MKNKKTFLIFGIIVITLLFSSIVIATERPVRGWLEYNNLPVQNATVLLKAKLYAHLANPAFYCYCDSQNQVYSSSTGEWVDNLNNLKYSQNCWLGPNQNDPCGDDWDGPTTHIWINVSGSSAKPIPLGNGYVTPNFVDNFPLIAGITYLDNLTLMPLDTIPPVIKLKFPANKSVINTRNVTFKYNVTDISNISNCKLIVDNSVVFTNLTVNRNITQFFRRNLTAGIHNWKVNCSDIFNNTGASEVWILNISFPNHAPNVTLIPNISFKEDRNYTVNLTKYFYDVDGDPLTYSATIMGNITMQINNLTGIVKLIPNHNFNGMRYVKFTAYDTFKANVTSNNVSINVTIMPEYDKFNGVTTDFYAEPNIFSVPLMKLENISAGKIVWYNNVVAGDDDYNKNIFINTNLINVNSTVLHKSVNSSAELFFYGLNFVNPIILIDGGAGFEVCDNCSLLTYINGTIRYNVTHFSKFKVTATQLAIWDESDAKGGSKVNYALDQVKFYANYTYVDGTLPQLQDCQIKFGTNPTFYTMTYNITSKLFEYNRSFISRGTYDYNISCTSKLDFKSLIDSITILNSAPMFNSSKIITPLKWKEDTINRTLILKPYFYDVDGDSLIYYCKPVNNISFVINQSDGGVSFTPQNNFYGVRNTSCLVNDGLLNSSYSNVFLLNVTPVNDIPVFSGPLPNLTWPMNTNITLNLNPYFSDVDSKLNCSALLTNNISILINSSLVAKFVPQYNFYGVRFSKINCTDGLNTVVSNLFKLNVTLNITSIKSPDLFNISKINDSAVYLNWSKVNGSNGYYLYYSSDPCILRGLSVSYTPPGTKRITLYRTNYTDANFSNDDLRYYRISAFKGLVQNISERMVGKQTFKLFGITGTGNSYHRANWIGIVFNNSIKAESFLDDIGSSAIRISKMEKINATEYSVVIHNKDTASNNYTLNPGIKYTLEMNSNRNYTIVGTAILKPLIWSLKGIAGTGNSYHRASWVALVCSNQSYQAESLLDDIGSSAIRISKMEKTNATAYSVVIHNKDTASNNYSINMGAGYVVETSSNLSYTPRG